MTKKQEKKIQEAIREVLLKPIPEKERLKQLPGRASKKELDEKWILIKR